MSINQALFPVSCVQSCRWAQIHCETIFQSRWLLSYLLCWIICPSRDAQRNLFWQVFAGGLKGPTVDKQSFNSYWSGPPRGQWSPLLKPLVWHCVSSLYPCWLHKAKVLCDCLQVLLFCFVCLTLGFFLPMGLQEPYFLGGRDLRGIWSYPDFSLSQCVEVWRTSSFVCSFPGTFPSPVSGAHLHFAEPHDCGWKMNYSAGICLTDRASLRLYTC